MGVVGVIVGLVGGDVVGLGEGVPLAEFALDTDLVCCWWVLGGWVPHLEGGDGVGGGGEVDLVVFGGDVLGVGRGVGDALERVAEGELDLENMEVSGSNRLCCSRFLRLARLLSWDLKLVAVGMMWPVLRRA